MSAIKFTSTKLTNAGKKGILKPDENGYYPLVVGGLNTFNSVGEYYTLEGAKQLFESSSVFMRRVANGNLKGEEGHPKRLPGWSDDDYLRRVMNIEETNVVCHFKEVWLDEKFGRDHPELRNPSLVAIMAKVKPAGPRGPALQASLDNPDENVCFSIRALTRDYYNRGTTHRVLNQIFCWDRVTEPGIATSNKWASPALEGHEPPLESIMEQFVTVRNLERILESTAQGLAMEDSRAILADTIDRLKHQDRIVTLPHLYAKW